MSDKLTTLFVVTNAVARASNSIQSLRESAESALVVARRAVAEARSAICVTHHTMTKEPEYLALEDACRGAMDLETFALRMVEELRSMTPKSEKIATDANKKMFSVMQEVKEKV